MASKRDVRQIGAEIEDLLHRVESISDPAVRANAMALVQMLMDLHGAAFERVVEILSDSEAGRLILNQKLAADDLVGSLLLLYGVHPEAFESRVENAIKKLQANKHFAAQVELAGIEDGTVHVRLRPTASHGCGSGAIEFKSAVEAAICDAAPEAAGVTIEYLADLESKSALVQLLPISAAAKQG